MYDNNIKIKSYVSIIRCNKDNKDDLYEEIKRNYSGNTFHVNTNAFKKIIICGSLNLNIDVKYL